MQGLQGLHQFARLALGRSNAAVGLAQFSVAATQLGAASQHSIDSQPSVCAAKQQVSSVIAQQAGAWSSSTSCMATPQSGAGLHGSWNRSLAALTRQQLSHQRSMSSAAQRSEGDQGSSSPGGTGSAGPTYGNSSSSSPEQEDKPRQPPLSQDVVYEGPLSKTHKMLKLVSIGNTLIAFAAAPAIVMYTDISYISRVGLASSLVIFGILTTGALHWITNPYVHELKFHAATQQIDVRTTTLFGGQRWRSFNLSDVQPLPWNRPVATFMAKDRFYYIDVYSFPDEDLLKRLTPDESTVPQGHKDDDDD